MVERVIAEMGKTERTKEKYYDIKLTTTFEVKTDLQWEKTGNVAVELDGVNRRGGLAGTHADFWIYQLHGREDVVYMQEPSFILHHVDKLIKDDKARTLWAGDNNNARLALVKLKDFEEIFRVLRV